MRRTLIILFTLFVLPINVNAQVFSPNNQMDTSDVFLHFALPPLEVLFENAKNGPSWELYTLKIEELNRKVLTEKRSWYQFVDFFGTYQYGVVGMNSYTDLGSSYPLIYQNSGGEQIWYNAGASIRFPLDKLVDKRNRTKVQKLTVKQAEKELEVWYEDRKMQIVELYVKSEEMLNNLKSAIEQYALSQAQYEMAEKDYIMGSINISALGIAKGQQVMAIQQIGKIKSELKVAILKLEIISCTKLLDK
ncbi:hypothetical protein SDC9_161704 [bioreactor metagenome]|uniref:Outer membrane efflux protein n=1 Tax=bioreactor metagenome TaxID=1076179 RepID=A0A645FJ35_9ZZZZ|nr:TolC family protein [Rikenellaceae bacterium]